MDFEFNLPVPSTVAAAMGWNQLGSGVTTQAPQPQPVEIKRPARPIPPAPRPLEPVTPEPVKSAPSFHKQTASKPVQPPVQSSKQTSRAGFEFKPIKIAVDTAPLRIAAAKAVETFSTLSSLIQNSRTPERVPDVPVAKVKEELTRVALNLGPPSIATADHRFPVMVILSLKSGLEKQYGKQTLM